MNNKDRKWNEEISNDIRMILSEMRDDGLMYSNAYKNIEKLWNNKIRFYFIDGEIKNDNM